MLTRLAAAAAALLLAACGGSPAPSPVNTGMTGPPAVVDEVSGILAENKDLYVVDDSVSSAYFHLTLPPDHGRVIPLNNLHSMSISLPSGIWVDLEAIGRLADGRIVVLSERLRGLIGEQGPILEYDYPLSEFGRRGLEGLAIRPLPDGSSRIAVLWEGGYPSASSIQPQIQASAGTASMKPLLFVHDLGPGETTDRVRWSDGLIRTELQVPIPEGAEPAAQRFRAPALVWHRPASAAEWSFIVLITSENATSKVEYRYHWLQRFNLRGQPIGEPLDIATLAPADIASANWEGLAWFEPGKSLIMVHEGFRDLPPHAFIFDIPEDWKQPGVSRPEKSPS